MTETGSITLAIATGEVAAGPLPVKVRTADGEMVGAGVSGSPISVPAGEYFVSVVTPDGRERGSGTMVTVRPGHDSVATGVAAPASAMRSAASAAMTAAAPMAPGLAGSDFALDAVFDRSVGGAEPAPEPAVSARLWSGNWLASWDSAIAASGGTPDLEHGIGKSVRLTETAPAIISHVRGQDQLLVLRQPAATRYAVVPYDECLACVGEMPNPQEIAARLVVTPAGPGVQFRSSVAEEANTLLSFVENGVLTEMWTVSEDMVNQGERAMYGAGASILRAVTGAYVLLRANHLDGVDSWLLGLAQTAPTLPDIAILRAEMLARLGMHEDALALLATAIGGPCPWFRSGLSYMLERVRLYIDVSANHDVPFRIAPAEMPQFIEARDRLDRLMRVLVRGQVLSTFDVPDHA